jgi:hypothetical protein
MDRKNFIIAMVVSALGLAGCDTPVRAPAAAIPNEVITISAQQPSLTPLPETKTAQTKGGIEISIVPNTFTLQLKTNTTERVISRRIASDFVGMTANSPAAFYDTPIAKIERSRTPYLAVAPERLVFQVKINNKLDRAFRGQGMIVQFNVGGKQHAVNPSAYANLVQSIVPPRNESVIELYGPPLSEIQPNTPVGIFLYDVVTKTDAAGNVTEKQNFEWYFTYTTQLKEQQNEVVKEQFERQAGPRVRRY